MLANQSQEEQPTNQSQKELNQSKNIIKEALLSNPGILNSIVINLEEKQNQQPNQVVQSSPLDVYQQLEKNQEPFNQENDNQKVNDQNNSRSNQIYQFEEQETPQKAYKQSQMKNIQKSKNTQSKTFAKQKTHKTKISKKQSIKNKMPETVEQVQIQDQQEGKKIFQKPKKTQRSSGITESNKNKNATKQTNQKNDQKTTQNKIPKMKQCSLTINIKEDKELQLMLSSKSRRIEKPIQKQKKFIKTIFWIEIALLTDSRSMKMIKYKTRIQNQPQEQFKQSKGDFYQKQIKPSNNQKYYDDESEQQQNLIKNKRKKNNQKINLGILSLLQIVTILKNQELLKYSLYSQFKNNHSARDLDEFIKKFTAGQLGTFNYKLIPFTLLDHRRLSELIFNLIPEKYYIGEIYSENEQVFNFLVSCYDLQSDKYYKLYKNIDQLSKIQWWKELIVDNKKKIDQAFKIKNANKKSQEANQHYRRNFDEKLRQKRR